MWFPFALSFALTAFIGTLIAKRVMKELDEYFYLWITTLFTLPFIFLIVVYFYEIPSFDRTFWAAISSSVVLNVFAAVFVYRAIKISEISLISPISAFNPVFAALISFITLGERIGIRGALGIGLVVLGAYILQISKANLGFLAPFKKLLSHKGVQLSLLAYFIWGITPSFEKIAIFHTEPEVPPFASLIGLLLLNIVFFFLVARFSKFNFRAAKKFFPLIFLVGLLSGIGGSVGFIALSRGPIGFVTAVFKLSMVFTVVFGWLIFKEKDLKNRLLGSLIMLGGVYLLAT